jgi:hypothetical protein
VDDRQFTVAGGSFFAGPSCVGWALARVAAGSRPEVNRFRLLDSQAKEAAVRIIATINTNTETPIQFTFGLL